METYHFYAQFERYIKSSNSIPKGIIYSQALVNMDKYWLKQIEDRGFNKNTSLQDFIGFIKDVILSTFSLKTRQAALFDAKQGNIEHSADFLETLTNMVNSANWKNISPEEATCYIFIHSVTNDIDKQICIRFLQTELKKMGSMGSTLPEHTRISPGTPMTRTNANGVSTMVPYFSSLGSYLNGSI